MSVWQSATSGGLILDHRVLRLADSPPLLISDDKVWDAFTTDQTFEGPAFYSHPPQLPRRLAEQARQVSCRRNQLSREANLCGAWLFASPLDYLASTPA